MQYNAGSYIALNNIGEQSIDYNAQTMHCSSVQDFMSVAEEPDMKYVSDWAI